MTSQPHQPTDRHDAENASRTDDTAHSGGGVRGALNELLGRGEHEHERRGEREQRDVRPEQRRGDTGWSEPDGDTAEDPAAAPAQAPAPVSEEQHHPEPAHPEQEAPAEARTDRGYADQARAAQPAATEPAATEQGHREPTPEQPADTTDTVRAEAEQPSTDAGTGHAAVGGQDAEGRERLVSQQQAESYASRWDALKGDFVDEPRQAVRNADVLVGELLDELQTLFRDQRQDIERGLDADETSTEDLRLALRRYRSFFDRLLSI